MPDWFKSWISSIVLGSWKTSLTNFIAGMCMGLSPILANHRMPENYEWLLVACGAFLMLNGFVSKDGDKQGTGAPGDPIRGTAGQATVQQVREQQGIDQTVTSDRLTAGHQ